MTDQIPWRIERWGNDETSREAELLGFTVKEKPVRIWLSTWWGRDGDRKLTNFFSAEIRRDNGNLDELDHSGPCKSLAKALNWVSKRVDGNPRKIGGIDLTRPKALSAIRAEGAEYYVMAYLMLEFGLVVSRANKNMPGYDLLAYHIDTRRSCKLQIKYRNSDVSALQIRNFDFDFLVVVGDSWHQHEEVSFSVFDGDEFKDVTEKRIEAFWPVWILERDEVERDVMDGYLSNPRYGTHYMNWNLIREFLSLNTASTRRSKSAMETLDR